MKSNTESMIKPIINKIFARTVNNSGITIDLKGNEFKTGCISDLNGSEIVVSIDSFNKKIISDFLNLHSLMLNNGSFLETWIEGDKVHLAILLNFSFLAEFMECNESQKKCLTN